MAQWVTVLAIRSDNLSSNPKNQTVAETQLLKVVLWPLCIYLYSYACMHHTYIHINTSKKV